MSSGCSVGLLVLYDERRMTCWIKNMVVMECDVDGSL